MDVILRLTKQGKDLGYEGETLQTFVKEQQIVGSVTKPRN